MSKQRTKKPTTGRRIVESWISTGQAGKRPIGAVWYEPVHSDLARRIDRAIAKQVRRAKLQWKRESAMIQAQNSGAGRRVNAGAGS